MLCLTLSRDLDSYLRIAADVGALYVKKPFYSGLGFEWFYSVNQRKYGRRTAAKAKDCAELRCFLKTHEAWQKESATRRKELSASLGSVLSVRQSTENTDTVEHYALQYVNAKTIEEKRRTLAFFSSHTYPGDPSPILEDADSENAELREAALDALSSIRHPKVREFALSALSSDVEKILPILVKNYSPKDKTALENATVNLNIDRYGESGWHHLHSVLLNLFDRYSDIKDPPKTILPILYETTRCSICRERILAYMGRRRMLTRETLEECLFDSNDDVRKYAEKRLKN